MLRYFINAFNLLQSYIVFNNLLIILFSFRFLATGDQVSSIAFAHCIGESTVYKIIKETCTVVMKVLSPIYLKSATKETWKKIVAGFWEHWNFPNCIGAIDDILLLKHLRILVAYILTTKKVLVLYY